MVSAVQEAWNNLDPGLKQWLLMGASLAISMIPGVGIAGLLLGCMIDGTFTDMLSAIKNGDWAMLGMCALGFVPGVKQAKMGFKVLGHADDIGKASKLGGRLGGQAHCAKVTEIVEDIKSRGLTPKKEFYVKGDGIRRFADVAALDAKGNPVELYQVGKMTKGGLPVAREQRALGDIAMWAEQKEMQGLTLSFVPYNVP